MDLHRLSVKIFAADPGTDPGADRAAVGTAEIVPVFHSWIQAGALGGTPIDVADYGHVHQGPGVVLIGHESDRAFDLSGGRAGLLFTLKRDGGGPLPARLARLFRGALEACRLLEAEESLKGRIRFRTGEAEIAFLDRLRAPNTPETLATLRPAVVEAAGKLYQKIPVTVEPRGGDPREPLAFRILAKESPTIDELLARL